MQIAVAREYLLKRQPRCGGERPTRMTDRGKCTVSVGALKAAHNLAVATRLSRMTMRLCPRKVDHACGPIRRDATPHRRVTDDGEFCSGTWTPNCRRRDWSR